LLDGIRLSFLLLPGFLLGLGVNDDLGLALQGLAGDDVSLVFFTFFIFLNRQEAGIVWIREWWRGECVRVCMCVCVCVTPTHRWKGSAAGLQEVGCECCSPAVCPLSLYRTIQSTHTHTHTHARMHTHTHRHTHTLRVANVQNNALYYLWSKYFQMWKTDMIHICLQYRVTNTMHLPLHQMNASLLVACRDATLWTSRAALKRINCKVECQIIF